MYYYNKHMIKIKLREIMWEKEITAVDIYNATGISTSTISNIIHGKRPNISLNTIDKLCDVLDCRIQDLLEFERVNK